VREPKSINELNADLFADDADAHRDDPVEARKKAMDYLARRDYGNRELVRKLANAGFDADVAAAAVARLGEEGLQNDRRFIESFIQSRINQGKGPVRIQLDLGQRGLPAGLVDEVLNDCDVDWYDLAAAVRLKKFGAGQPGSFKEKARQMRFLQQRGFEQAHIQSAVGATDDD